ncbi:hypothetical protein PG990_012500 [Apiospora arundinis]|uniref:Mitochondrial hypoxia responsive domain containing protein n=1 Tax=Apiospora arundinis TaxID=335852 RepID=A0ABR2HRF6_9PEZI
MKVVSQEEEAAHYNSVLKGGSIGGGLGLGLGLLGVIGASKRYPAFRGLTLPFRSFLVTSTATFGAMVNAERYSIEFQKHNNPMNFYVDEATKANQIADQQKTTAERLNDWGRENRYSIVFFSWLASMGLAGAMVGRNKYLSTSQKLVQARVYAQGLTLAVLIATAAFETADARSGQGRWETVKILDPDDPEHKKIIEKRVHKEEYEGQDLWMDMVAAEERRLADREKAKTPEGKEGVSK